MQTNLKVIETDMQENNFCYVPQKNDNYIKYGNYYDVLSIIRSKKFFPVWITGDAGTGKTQMVQQACAEANREFIRFNFTTETDETDMLGGMRLVEKNGVTVTEFYEGPVIEAMRRGAVLLLDEIDAGHTNKILALQSILEGEGVLLKEKNEFVKPEEGFTIFATSNTKGKGSEDGRFIGTNIMNSAFLDRFAGMLYQDFPELDIENAIISSYYLDFMYWSNGIHEKQVSESEYIEATKFVTNLCKWANQIRLTYKNQGCEEVITTRCLISIVKSYSIFKNKNKAIEFACEKFPTDIKQNFIQIYDKMTEEPEISTTTNKTKKYYEDLSREQMSF